MRTEDAIYLRKSRADYEDESKGYTETLDRHRKTLIQLAKDKNLNVVEIYEEVVSGETIRLRPEMQRLLNDIYMKKYRSVLVVEIERLARGNTADQGEVANAFKFSDTLIITPNKTYDPNNEQDEEYFEFGLFMARREYKTIRRRLQGGINDSIREGNYFGPVAPYGYDVLRRGRNDRTLVPNENAKYVKLMFDMKAKENLGVGEISRRLTEMGVPTYKNIGEWDRSTLRDILQNDIYTGKIRWNRRTMEQVYKDGKITLVNRRNKRDAYLLVEGKHEAIIEQDIFDQVQALFEETRKPYKPRTLYNIFAGLIKCSKCGKAMKFQSYRTKKNTRDRIAHSESHLCNARSVYYDDVIDIFINSLNEQIADFQFKSFNTNNDVELQEYKMKLDKMERDHKQLKTERQGLFDSFNKGYFDGDEFMEQKEIYNERIYKIEKKLLNLKPPKVEDFEEKIHTFKNIVESLRDESLSASDKNILLRNVISRIDYTYTNGIELDVYFKN